MSLAESSLVEAFKHCLWNTVWLCDIFLIPLLRTTCTGRTAKIASWESVSAHRTVGRVLFDYCKLIVYAGSHKALLCAQTTLREVVLPRLQTT